MNAPTASELRKDRGHAVVIGGGIAGLMAVDRPLKLVITEDRRWAATRVKVNPGPVKP